MADNKLWVGNGGTLGDWNVAANWSPSGVPVDTDHVLFENSAISATATLDQSAVTLGSLTIDQSFTGRIGTSTTYLQVGATVVTIGEHTGYGTPNGSDLLKINLGAVASTVTVHNTNTTSADTDRPPVRLLFNEATSVLTVRKGSVGVAVNSDFEASSLATINIDYVNNIQSDAKVNIGTGVTLVTLAKTGGECWLSSAATTITNRAGDLKLDGTGAYTTINIYGGLIVSNSTGTITTLNAFGGTVDFLQQSAARTLTTLNQYGRQGGSIVQYDPSVLTVTNKVAPADRVVVAMTAG